jgi:endo-1,4-beta-xylanase
MKEWCTAKNAVDNLILKGEIRPLIIVMPNGRSTANFGDTSFNNMQSFYTFGQEIRNDLLPWMDSHYATYGSLTPDDLSAARDHRYMAGLSMGGMQTINIGLCECLDLFSAFGAFSAAPTSYTASRVAAEIGRFENCPIRFFYSVCGLQDNVAYASASAAAKDLLKYTDRLTEENWCWQECGGAHSFEIWNLGLYNFLRILGS